MFSSRARQPGSGRSSTPATPSAERRRRKISREAQAPRKTSAVVIRSQSVGLRTETFLSDPSRVSPLEGSPPRTFGDTIHSSVPLPASTPLPSVPSHGGRTAAWRRNTRYHSRRLLDRAQATASQLGVRTTEGKKKFLESVNRAGHLTVKGTQQGSQVIFRHIRSASQRVTAGKDGREHDNQKKREPFGFRMLLNMYHKYGLKHMLLIIAFVFYVCVGALVFVMIEQPAEERLVSKWKSGIETNRVKHAEFMIKSTFNNSNYLIFLDGRKSRRMKDHMLRMLHDYEKTFSLKHDHSAMPWNYWSAVLFTGSLCTTIGYGHVFPRTDAGKILTIIYALGGIPLMLLLLQDLGALMTMALKWPWWMLKRLARRLCKCCTKQSYDEMRLIEKAELENIAVFDVPIPLAILMVVAWNLLCALIFTLTDDAMSWTTSFYFFFISLSTIGLGDIIPDKPEMLLYMFGFIIIGLSLVSMVINLIQQHLNNTYQSGISRMGSQAELINQKSSRVSRQAPTVATLGVFQSSRQLSASNCSLYGDSECCYQSHPPNKLAPDSVTPTTQKGSPWVFKKPSWLSFNSQQKLSSVVPCRRHQHHLTAPTPTMTRYAQTALSLPQLKQLVLTCDGIHWITDDSVMRKSPDEVTHLVEAETDYRVLADVAEEYDDGISLVSNNYEFDKRRAGHASEASMDQVSTSQLLMSAGSTERICTPQPLPEHIQPVTPLLPITLRVEPCSPPASNTPGPTPKFSHGTALTAGSMCNLITSPYIEDQQLTTSIYSASQPILDSAYSDSVQSDNPINDSVQNDQPILDSARSEQPILNSAHSDQPIHDSACSEQHLLDSTHSNRSPNDSAYLEVDVVADENANREISKSALKGAVSPSRIPRIKRTGDDQNE